MVKRKNTQQINDILSIFQVNFFNKKISNIFTDDHNIIIYTKHFFMPLKILYRMVYMQWERERERENNNAEQRRTHAHRKKTQNVSYCISNEINWIRVDTSFFQSVKWYDFWHFNFNTHSIRVTVMVMTASLYRYLTLVCRSLSFLFLSLSIDNMINGNSSRQAHITMS